MFNAGSVQTYDCERDPVLYVMQGETAIVSPRDGKSPFMYYFLLSNILFNAETIEIVMTDDTTTCCTGIIRHCTSGVTCLTHYDRPLDDNLFLESLEANLSRMIHLGRDCDSSLAATTQEKSTEFDLYLIGGYLDEKKISEDLAIYLLKSFNSLPSQFTINLVCAFIGEFNTQYITISTGIIGEATIPAPIVYGSAVNLRTGTVCNALLDRKKGNGIPMFDIRRASVSFGNAKKYWEVYDPEKRLLVVHPVYFDILRSPESLNYFTFAYKLKDQDILKVLPFLLIKNAKRVFYFVFRNFPLHRTSSHPTL